MRKRADFSDDVAAVKDTAESEVASLLKLVEHGRGTAPAQAIPALATDSLEVAEVAGSSQASEVRRSSPRRRVARTQLSERDENLVVLENVTTRLTRGTNERLTEVALRQKLAKAIPDSRQEIMEDALLDWFERNGYGDSEK